jgi:hypothetical protein
MTQTRTRTGDYTWIDAATLCGTDCDTNTGCPDCDTDTPCADCAGTITAGTPAWYCIENGELIHGTCSPQDTADKWGPGYW